MRSVGERRCSWGVGYIPAESGHADGLCLRQALLCVDNPHREQLFQQLLRHFYPKLIARIQCLLIDKRRGYEGLANVGKLTWPGMGWERHGCCKWFWTGRIGRTYENTTTMPRIGLLVNTLSLAVSFVMRPTILLYFT